MQSTGQTATQPVSRQSRQSRVMMYAMAERPSPIAGPGPLQPGGAGLPPKAAAEYGWRAPMAVVFPSTAFFLALRDAMRSEQARFQRLGFFDATFGVRVLPAGPAPPPADPPPGLEVFACAPAGEGIEGGAVDFAP